MMYLSYEEIMNLIKKEAKKHQDRLEESNPQVDKDYPRHAVYVLRDLEKEVRKYLAKKYR